MLLPFRFSDHLIARGLRLFALDFIGFFPPVHETADLNVSTSTQAHTTTVRESRSGLPYGICCQL